jgi:hypothetical protein
MRPCAAPRPFAEVDALNDSVACAWARSAERHLGVRRTCQGFSH